MGGLARGIDCPSTPLPKGLWSEHIIVQAVPNWIYIGETARASWGHASRTLGGWSVSDTYHKRSFIKGDKLSSAERKLGIPDLPGRKPRASGGRKYCK